MRILVLSNAAWDDRNSVGNTQSNWFTGWENTEFCSMYTRGALPNNNCCSSYYVVSTHDIISHFYSRNKIGVSFNNNDAQLFNNKNTTEEKVLSVGGWKRIVLRRCVGLLYASNIWFNKKIKQFILKYNPDIVFCFAIAEPFRYNIVKYVKRKTNAKVVLWVADDVWGQVNNKHSIGDYIYRKRYQQFFKVADKVYGVSEMLCKEYSQLFKIPIEPLYKGCTCAPCKTSVGTPIKMIYAGNLLYGRDRTLSELVNCISKVNTDETKIELSIYTSSHITPEITKQLNVAGCSSLHGVLPYNEIKRLMSHADIVLHVESFQEKQINSVRLSFSTKIIDCFQSGSAMMVIGPKGIASVEYLRSVRGCIIVDELSDVHSTLIDVVSYPKTLLEKARLIHDFALRNHRIDLVHTRLMNDFESLLK